MQVYISNKEIAQIAQGLVHISCGKPPPKYIDIDAVAKYLGLNIYYEQIAEDDQDKIGFVSNGVTALKVIRNGTTIEVVFPKDTIVLDKFLLRPTETYRSRFVKAHEISHVLINRADPTHSAPCFNRVYDREREYSISELHDRMSLGECRANTMAAMILMPIEVLTDSVRRHFRKKSIPVYGDCVFLPKMKPILRMMSQELGVSHTALIIQLQKYGLLEPREMTEYFQKIMSQEGIKNEHTNE